MSRCSGEGVRQPIIFIAPPALSRAMTNDRIICSVPSYFRTLTPKNRGYDTFGSRLSEKIIIPPAGPLVFPLLPSSHNHITPTKQTTKSPYNTLTEYPQYHYPFVESCLRLSLVCECPLRVCARACPQSFSPPKLSIQYDLDEVTRLYLSTATQSSPPLDPHAFSQTEFVHYTQLQIEFRFPSQKGVSSIRERSFPHHPESRVNQTIYDPSTTPLCFSIISIDHHNHS